MPLNTLSQIFNTTAIKAIPNQNNNLLDFVGTSGTTVASVTAGGVLDLRATSGTVLGDGSSVIGNKIQLWADTFGIGIQSGRLVIYNDSGSATSIRTSLTGSDIIRFNNDGNLSTRYVDSLANSGAYLDLGVGTAGIIAVNRNAAHIPLTIRGAVSQSVSIQEWQNSGGTVLASISSAGAVSINTTGTGTINLGDGTISKTSGTGFQFNSGAVFTSTISASGLSGSLLSSATPIVDGTAAVGTSAIPSRQDHVHPTDTSRAATSGTLAQFAATTSAQLAGVISDETGSGLLVFATSPTLVTPTLGVASATSINKVAITAPATGSTLTIIDGKTLTVSNTLTFNGTDASTVAFGAGGTVAYTNVTTLSSLSSIGTVTSGTWNATAIGTVYGGTGLTSYTTGDIVYASASNTLSKRTIGSTGQVLTVSGGVPTWSTPSTGADEIMVIMGAY
jgi:hypothetical protein